MDPPVITEEMHVDGAHESNNTMVEKDRLSSTSRSSDDLSKLNTHSRSSSPSRHQAHNRPCLLSRSSSIGGETGSDSSVANSPLMERVMYKRSRKSSESKTPTESEFDEDESEELEDGVKITVGVCAMNKKTYSRPMKEILNRLRKSNLLHFIVFQDEMILNEDVEKWPVVDCLISFYSTGFPLDKAIKYVELRQPFLLNDLKMQYLLMDRRKVYEMLVNEGIAVPRYGVFNRDSDNKPIDSDTDLIEYDDNIEINGQVFTKPFVEKPVSAEDHNIYIYYPLSAGGGCQILFRKIGSRSSVYSSESRVRRTGSYLYEEFMATAGTDVKVYTVGEEYAHAEARKSPALDGKVERDAQGKEIRYPVILSAAEKLIAKQVCSIFKQTVCGFDLLRTNGKSYVCDVNGFSFVKTSQKYYDDCSQILADIIFQNLAPQFWIPNPQLYQVPQFEEEPVMTTEGTMLELRCIVAIIRHGDRTPKQKMKMIVHNKLWFDLFDKYGGPDEGKLKLKTPKQLQEVLDITRELLQDVQDEETKENIRENPIKLLQMKSVLEMYGHFSGINRKIQLKSLNDKRNIDMKKKFKGRNKNADPPHSDSGNPTLLLILKWGGELTPMGKKQAEELGRAFRCMYPGGQVFGRYSTRHGEYGVIPGCGFLRLHSTYRHDLKIYASDEGRVQMTAAAFAKGLLQLEGELPPILASLVKSDKNVTGMLDATADVSLRMLRVKSQIHDIMHIERNFTEEDVQKLAPTRANSLTEAMKTVSNPHLMCDKVHEGIRSLTAQISALCEKPDIDPNAPILYHDESIRLMENRWQKLEKVETNPYHYDSHLELIKELRSLGDLEKLRKAREKMAEIFPLTEELWIEWLNDEMPLVVVPGHKEYIISLFEKAVQDYLSVRIWLQYCQFVMDGIESSTGIDAVRKIFEQAITAVGIHLTQGSSVWDSYREFEMALLESMQANQEDSDDDKIDAQIQRVEGIYRRQLAVPLHDMDSTKEEYEDWTSEPIPDNIVKAFEKAMIKYEQCMEFENNLATASSPKLAEYQDYISFEMKDGDPARIQCMFERAITENCLNTNVWQQYTQYLDHKLKVPAVAVKVHARAVRNCPWVSSLWVDYLKALARNKSSCSDIKDVFQKALGCGFSSGEEYLQLWLTNCDYMKGRITDWEADTIEVEELRKTFDKAITYMDHYFGNDGDKSSLIRRYWAAVEAKYLKNLTKAQELWDSIIKAHSKETHMWLEYTHFLRLYGDVVSCRRAFQRAVQTTVDDPEKLCEAFLNFERIEGNFSQLESAVEKTKNLRTRIDTKRLKEAEEQAEKLKANVEKEERRKQAKLQKNRENKKLGKQQKSKDKQPGLGKGDVSKKERIEKEQNVMERSTKQTKETTKQSDEMHQEEKQEVGEPPSKKARVDATDEKQRENQDVGMKIAEELHEDRKAHNEATMKQTVFLSNLLFTVDEEAIKSKFKDVGEINEIRIVRNLVGRSKGFAYLEFKDESSVTKALQMDRELLNGRPMFVSQCVDKSKNQPQQFRYKLSLDKQTVFVTNLPFESTREEIEELFKTAGEIKEVRIVTNRAGKPKGYAYVEFLNESSAASAVLNLDKHIMKEREINVALSKPPARRQNEKGQVDPRMEHKSLPQGSRGRARTQLAMVPRSIHTQPSSKQTQSTKQIENKDNADKNASDKPQGKMSNADFSKMFAK